MRALRRASIVAACVLAGVLVPEAAFAATAPVSPSFGRDVSSDTCAALQAPEDFGVVAVNFEIATKANECLPAELAWAAGSTGVGHDAVDVYVLSADPGPALASWWPSSDRTQGGVTVHSPYKACVGKKATTACAWVYGNSLARNQVALVDPTASIGRWWIDVEGGASGNTWSSSTAQNRAVVEGMVAGFTASKKRVGLYAATSHFREVLGTVPTKSSISKLPFWAAGATSRADALHRCSTSSMTAGRLTLVQWTESGDTSVDYDVACGTLTQPKPTISGKYHPKHKLTAKVKTWSPAGVHLTYRWTRDGKAIAKATHSTYTLTKKDRRHRIGVTVTGTLNGYSRAVQKSATHRIGS